MSPFRFGVSGALGLVLLCSCRLALPPSRDTILREFYVFVKVSLARSSMPPEPDTTNFATYAAAATADTATWNETCAFWRQARALYSSVLGQLGYGTGPFTWNYGSRERTALARFQRDVGIAVTAKLDSLTVTRLLDAQQALIKANLVLPSLRVNKFDADGTWKAVTNQLAYPVNTVHIQWGVTGFAHGQVEGFCNVTTVTFIGEELNQPTVTSRSFPVVRWDRDVLIARDGDEPDAVTVTINARAQDVTWTQEWAGEIAAGMDTLHPQRMTLRLVDGSRLCPPFDGGDLKAEHDALYKDKERYLALRTKNTILR